MALSNASKAGVAIFVGAVQYTIFWILSEVIYSANVVGGYSESSNYISDLGANCPSSGPCYIPPSALLYNSTIVILGLLVLVGAFYLHRAFRWKPAAGVIALAGIGAIGVGVFPETSGDLHVIFSLITFLFAGLSAVVTARFQKKPLSLFSVILGLVTLLALIAYIGGEYAGLGAGGMERVVVLPVLVWAIGFGGHLMAIDETHRP